MKRTNISIGLLIQILLFSSQTYCNKISAEISCGELIDKITILKIKSERITDSEKLKNVHTELEALQQTCDEYIGKNDEVEKLQKNLQEVNQALWDIEDAIRVKERNKEFDDEFIQIARSVYITNDKRCVIKKEIDKVLGSRITEEKSYEEFATK
jgi:predicted nuclease with TOPRIM domain